MNGETEMSSREPAPTAAEGVRARAIESLPGPRGLPVLGNALQIDASRIHHVVEGWARQYGDFFWFRLGARKVLAKVEMQYYWKGMRKDVEEHCQSCER